MSAPPLRFLGVVLGGWVFARAAVLAPNWLTETADAREDLPRKRPDAAPPPSTIAAARALPAEAAPGRERPSRPQSRSVERETPDPPVALALDFAGGQVALGPVVAPVPETAAEAAPAGEALLASAESPVRAPVSPAAVLQAGPARLTVSGWAIVRQGGDPQLATGGVLGGSQAGARAVYRMSSSLALSGRVSSPLAGNGDGAEAAVGVEWQPSRTLPVKILAERRQAIGDEGRSAFALVVHGGVSDVKVAGPVVAEAYGQAGVVGVHDRDAFADGAVKLGVPVGSGVSVGAGAWGAAQPGVARLDVGPQVTMTLPGGRATLRVSAEWRVRVAGNAEPGSGPAITLAAGF